MGTRKDGRGYGVMTREKRGDEHNSKRNASGGGRGREKRSIKRRMGLCELSGFHENK